MQKIISKYLNHSASEDEIVLLEEWMNESPENKEEVLKLKNNFVLSSLMDKFDQSTELNKADDCIQTKEQTLKPEKKNILLKSLMKYAAILVGVSFLSVFFYHQYSDNNVNYQTLTVLDGERAKIILADGSEIWLNSNTEIIYPDNFNRSNRDVKLLGEAYFKVAKNSDLPFTINTQDIDVKVVGTEFNVRSYPDDNTIDVQVVEGKVLVTSESNTEDSHLLTANEMITFDKNSASFNESSFDSESENWREGRYVFNNKTLKDIIRQMERIYAVEFIVKDKALLDEVYYGEINMKDSLAKILEIMSINDRFNYEINNKQITITND